MEDTTNHLEAVLDDGTEAGGASTPSTVSTVGDGAVLIDGLIVRDRVTADFVRDRAGEPADLETGISDAIQIGVRAIRTSEGSLDARTVEERFAGLSEEVERNVDDLVEGFATQAKATGETFKEVADGLLDAEEGTLINALEQAKTGILDSIDGMFDEESKKSVLAKIEKVMETAQAEHREQLSAANSKHQEALSKLVDPNAEDGPIARLNSQISKEIKDRTESIEKTLVDLVAKVAANEAADQVEKEMKDASTQKGVEFEVQLLRSVERLAAPLNDSVYDSSTEVGADGNKKGDLVVELDTGAARVAEARYVIEAKDSSLSYPETKRELGAGMSNRLASAGIIVFANADQSPFKHTPFHWQGNMAWVVYDKETEDDYALRVALLWARWVTLRELREGAGEVDAGRIADLVATASEALKASANVKRAHTTAKNQLDKSLGDADRHLGTMVEKIAAALGDIEAELEEAEESGQA